MPRKRDDDDEEDWWSDLPNTGPSFRDMMEEFANEGLGPPDTWARYDVRIGLGGHVEATITDDGGEQFSIEGDVNFETEDFQWAWDIWEWIEEMEYDIDMDAHYEEK